MNEKIFGNYINTSASEHNSEEFPTLMFQTALSSLQTSTHPITQKDHHKPICYVQLSCFFVFGLFVLS